MALHPQALQLRSTNFSSRNGELVTVVVLHHISLPPSEFGGAFVEYFFTNRLDPGAHPFFQEIAAIRVSSHFYIKRNGSLVQFVDTADAAWHAGVSVYKGREGVNAFSVGIELEGDMTSPYTDSQYSVLRNLIQWIREKHPDVGAEAVVGHEHVSPGRKTDPGPLFDWGRIGLGKPSDC